MSRTTLLVCVVLVAVAMVLLPAVWPNRRSK